MKKLFLFLFAAVLSIGTAMAQNTEVFLEGATVSLESGSLLIQAQWGERLVTISLWQENTQGTGNYAQADVTGMMMNPYAELSAVNDECTYQESGTTFSFSGLMTDGTTTYDCWIQGSTDSGEGSGEGSGENYVEDEALYASMTIGKSMMSEYVEWSATYSDDDWSIELYTDGAYEGFGELTVFGYYTPASGEGFDVTGTGNLYFDDATNKLLFQTNELVSADGNTKLYINLYASELTLMASNIFEPTESWAGATYTNIVLNDPDWAWWLDLHVNNYTGAGDYYDLIESTLCDEIPVTGSVSVFLEDGLHTIEASLETQDAAMTIAVLFFEVTPAVYDITANATVAVGEYPLEFTCTWTDSESTEHSVKVEVLDVVFDQAVAANLIWDGGIWAGGDNAEATVKMTKSGSNVTVEGQFVSFGTGNTYNVNLTGALPAGVRETITLVDGEDYSALLAQYAGQKVNVVVERTLGTDGLYTLTVPFDMPASELGTAYQISSVVENIEGDEIQVMCTKATTIKAGQPYIIEAYKGFSSFGIENVLIQNVTGSTVTAKGNNTTVTMHGVINTTGETTDGLWWIGESGYLYNDDVDMLGLRTYFTITTPSGMPPRVRVVTGENTTTDIENIQTSVQILKAIEDGQLIIIREGVKYNIQGQKL